jgi:hypothetical protein
VTGKARDPSACADCHCCGRSFPVENMVAFHHNPGDHVCVTCIDWLDARSRPIARRLWPIWQLPARLRYRVKGTR